MAELLHPSSRELSVSSTHLASVAEFVNVAVQLLLAIPTVLAFHTLIDQSY